MSIFAHEAGDPFGAEPAKVLYEGGLRVVVPDASNLSAHSPAGDGYPHEAAGTQLIAHSLTGIFPGFILGFLATSLVNTLHLLPPWLLQDAAAAGKFLIVVALAAVGLNANVWKMTSAGFRPILLGLGVWMSVAVSSLLIQRLVG